MRYILSVLITTLLCAVAAFAGTDSAMKEFNITIKDHIFTPAELKIPAGEKVKIIVDNQDPTPEEFESHDLNREKIISGNSKGIIFIGPLDAGTYNYFGEFNEDVAKGTIVAE